MNNQSFVLTSQEDLPPGAVIGNRIPKDYFVTQGQGESDITIHAGSYHLALKQAGIEMCNHITYSSILPGIAQEVQKPDHLVHGSVMENISAVANAEKGQRATASIIFAWLYERKTGKRYGGLVCEYNGHDEVEIAQSQLRQSLQELYTHGFEEDYELKDPRITTESFIPQKKYGTALVAICFTSYIYPVVK